ncbi:MAG: DUF1501 domain-containing protein [Bryobacterales bacterium]|nr:DUF1501 domain-containing protein [Bryobacterales bacterium]
MSTKFSRRDVLRLAGTGLGMVGLSPLLAETLSPASPLAPKAPHFPAKAKHVIHLFLNGAPSHVDSFDYKPMLEKYDGKPYPGGNLRTERKTGALMKSPFEFKPRGESGIPISEIFSELGGVIDDCCVINSMRADMPFHEPSLFLFNSGQRFAGHPSMGAWLTYGLGTENQNLPGYVVMCPGFPVVGPQLWTSAYLPGAYQGSYIRNTEIEPEKLVPFLTNSQRTPEQQRDQMDLLGTLNRAHLEREGDAPELEATIHSMEVAYRMQSEAMDAFDVRKESDATRALYGEGDFAQGCLIARRLVERGVRVVQVYYGNSQPWDTHDDILKMRELAGDSDRPMAALIRDLKTLGLLDETLVVISGEFGRTPTVEVSGRIQVQAGRDHNSHGFSSIVAGGGFRGGLRYGATDDFGFRSEVNPVHVHDLHATLLNQLGLDHKRLTYRHSGRDFRLTDVHGEVVRDLIA